jgi:SAM-dependent methyltransferase
MAAVNITPPDKRELLAHLHEMWAAVAGSWAEHADYIDERGAEVTQAMLDATSPGPGERVLELASGPGSVGLAAAELVAPDGEVVVSDVAMEMAAYAATRAEQRGLTNVSARALDLEDIDEPDGAYDVVLCREGLMFATDPARAARELRRVLRPGGRFAVAVWGPRGRNPWLGIVFDAVGAQLQRPVPPPGVPGPFSLEDRGRLGGLFAEAGFADVVVSEMSVPLRAASFAEWWSRTSSLAGPLTTMLASLSEPAIRSLDARLRAAVEPYQTPDGLDFPGVTLLATGRAA